MPQNREGWLTELADRLKPIFKDFRVGKFRVTCGWPCRNGVSGRNRRIGECHAPQSSADGYSELFISPVLDKPIEVAGVLCHEMTHVVAGVEAAHGKGFVRVARHVGLTKGRPTSADMGPLLRERVGKIVEPLGPYPHSKLTPVPRVSVKTSSVRVLECDCGCRVTMSVKILDEHGPPTCPCGEVFQPQG